MHKTQLKQLLGWDDSGPVPLLGLYWAESVDFASIKMKIPDHMKLLPGF